MGLLDLAANAHLFLEFGDRQKEVGVEVHHSIEAVEELQLLRRVIAVVAKRAPHDRPVLLLDEGAVVLLVGPTAGEGDLLLQAVAIQLVINELGTIVRIKT